jgi:hypothetical protein
VHYIQSTKFGVGNTAKQEKAIRRSMEVDSDVDNEFVFACRLRGFDPDNLSEWEEEEAMRAVGWIN